MPQPKGDTPKLRSEERNRLVWEALVRYANTAKPPALAEAFERSASTIPVGYMLRLKDVDEVREIGKDLSQGVEVTDTQRALLGVVVLAPRYHEAFRRVLSWLSAPKKNSALARDAGKFLGGFSAELKWTLRDANDEFDETGEEGYPIFLWPNVEHCRSILSPICQFILDRIWEFQEGGTELKEAIPIEVCEREGCGNFTLPERRGRRRFCSDKCRALAFQRSRGDWNEYMRKYRKLKRDRKLKAGHKRRRR
jgi:hypothetical protein